MNSPKIQPVSIAICCYCVVQSGTLLRAWKHSPFDRWAWFALIIWLLPLVKAIIERNQKPQSDLSLSGLGLLFCFIGAIGSVSFVKYTGLAFALGGLRFSLRSHWLWLAAAISWMPAFGYFGSQIGGPFSFDPCALTSGLRILIAAAAVIYLRMRNRNKVPEAQTL